MFGVIFAQSVTEEAHVEKGNVNSPTQRRVTWIRFLTAISRLVVLLIMVLVVSILESKIPELRAIY